MTRALMAVVILWSMLAMSTEATPSARPSPPNQPTSGPGGSDYRFDQVRAERVGAPTGFWLFSPERAADTDPLPVVVFLHGFSAVDPFGYGAWIDHIVRRGAVLIYPEYQTKDLTQTSSAKYQPNAIAGIEAAIALLGADHAGPVDLDSIAIVGHSLGAVLSLNIAALAGGLKSPTSPRSCPPNPEVAPSAADLVADRIAVRRLERHRTRYPGHRGGWRRRPGRDRRRRQGGMGYAHERARGASRLRGDTQRSPGESAPDRRPLRATRRQRQGRYRRNGLVWHLEALRSVDRLRLP